MKRFNIIALIIIHSLSAIITILTNSIIIDMAFMLLTLVLVVKLLKLVKHFCFDAVKENDKGEY